MILECPSCRAKYLVHIGLLAQGGRQVRCARCKNEWLATLPTTIDVFEAPPESVPEIAPEVKADVASEPNPSAEPSSADKGNASSESAAPQLPALIESKGWLHNTKLVVLGVILIIGSLLWPILDREPIVKAIPELRGFYNALHLYIKRSGEGLVFDQVQSDLRYDGGTMWLHIDGVIRNDTSELQLIPNIKARALGPDRHIIQSWWVEAPAATIDAGGQVPFHTQIAAPMQRTIESVYLEFYAQDEKVDVGN